MAHHKIEFDEACKTCDATGLYVGMAEKDGAAVVCHRCKGTGCRKTKIEYDDFEGRQPRADITRVFQHNPGVFITRQGDSGPEYNLEDFGGMSYREWALGFGFPKGREIRKFSCPAWWYQSVDYDKKPYWEDGEVQCIRIGSFSECRHFKEKHKCWKRWDKEFGGE